MTDEPIRIFIDTNIWISAFINPSGPPAAIIAAFNTDKIIAIISQQFLNELAGVLTRNRIRQRLRVSGEDADEILARVREKAVRVYPTGAIQLCRDKKDDVMLETAILGRAHYIVSRDDDIKRDLNLIAYLHEHNIEVVTVAQFLKLLDEG
jgi:putative PIN family toxin of toxin-antitoxin system